MSLKHLMRAYRSLRTAGEDFALATIVATEGSTYRKPGARMLIGRSGETLGLLGGGAFEHGLAEAARRLLDRRQPELLYCDMPGSPDPAAGAAGETDGTARILLQWQGPDNAWRDAELLERSLASGRSGVLATVTGSSHPDVEVGRSALAWPAPGGGFPAGLAEEVEAAAQAALRAGRPMLVSHPADEWEVEVFYSIVRPAWHLLIAGAGPDAAPLCHVADLLGWTVSIVDPRAWLAQAPRFPEADQVLVLEPEHLEGALAGQPVQAAVIMTHHSELDLRFLRRLLDGPAPYIGLLGSKTRCAQLLDRLGAQRDRAGTRLHAPIGLKIGADSAEEIALAIAAEILSLSAGFGEAAGPAPAPAGPAAWDAGSALYAVILAGGGGKRFGALKQLLEFEGESLLRRAVKLANRIAGARVVVVHGPKATKCQREIASFPVTHAVNEYWEYGIASSLKLGIRSLPEDAAAALIILCDQPLIGAPQLQALVDAWTGDPRRPVACGFAGTYGAPAILPRSCFNEAQDLAGDRGAKAILAAHEAELRIVPVPEAEMDIDTQDDYTRILTRKPA